MLARVGVVLTCCVAAWCGARALSRVSRPALSLSLSLSLCHDDEDNEEEEEWGVRVLQLA